MPSFSETTDVLKSIVKILSENRTFASSFVTLQDATKAVVETAGGDLSNNVNFSVESLRSLVGSLISTKAIRQSIDQVLLMYKESLDLSETGINALINKLIEYMVANSQTIKSRDLTLGGVTAGGSNVGTGTIYRCVTDKWGYQLQNCYVDKKTVLCTSDRNSGATSGVEQFSISTEFPGKDDINNPSSGRNSTLSGVTYSLSNNLISNPSFNSIQGTPAVPTEISSWEVSGDIADLEVDRVNYFRDFISVIANDSAGSLVFKDNNTISQNLTNRSRQFNRVQPYLMTLAYFAETAVSAGTLALTIGEATHQVTLTTDKNQWNRLTIPLNEDLWFDNFNQTSLSCSITVASLAGGNVKIDDLIVVPMNRFDGLYYSIVGGQTPFKLNDVFTFESDSESGNSLIQREFWRGYGVSLPHSGTPTIADPS